MRTPSSVPPPVTAVIDAAGNWLATGLAEVERGLAAAVGGGTVTLGGDARSTLEAGGKRMRPMLVLLCAGGRGGEAAVRAAVAVELVHMASLVHDDVLDRAPLRRGRPTVYAESGRGRATSLGDLLFSASFGILAEDGDAGAIETLSATAVDLARGELMQRQDAFDAGISAERYMERCRLKTGRLFECACELGRAAAGHPADPVVTAFGRRIGLAFQLLDDVLDVSGPPERTGKARGTDLLDGTATLPLILAVERDPELAGLDLRRLDPAGAEALCDRIAATGALEEVRSTALRMVSEAKRAIEVPELEAEQRRLLGLIADGVVSRYS